MCNIIKASVSNHLNLTLVSLILFCSSCEKSKNDLEQNEILSCCENIPSRIGTNANILKDNMVWIPDGEFTMGAEVADFMNNWPFSARSRVDERPLHRVKLDGFWMSRTPVTNQEFKNFVDSTGYITTAEKPIKLEDIMKGLPPGTPPPEKQSLEPSSMVFTSPERTIQINNVLSWWRWQKDANWRQPEGPGSSIENRMDHPVVQISYYDALAYADWKEMSLPTEAQWEYAARGGHEQQMFTWGNTPIDNTNPQINIWQGSFPYNNTLNDGYEATSPVTAFPPNDYGLYDMSGNVWEWVADWYHNREYSMRLSLGTVENPIGPKTSYDPDEPYLAKRVIRGGSFLCNDSYCSGYRPGARMKTSPDSSANHTGFRVVKNISK
jgi:sulfatase modifying factor 1